jgi:ribosomal protein S12 methylthiotransferase
VQRSLDDIGEALRERQGSSSPAASGRRTTSCEEHPSVLAITGPTTRRVMHAVHEHLPRPHDPYTDLSPGIKLTPPHYAYLKIAEGCNHRCTFCIIPSMRGDLVSRRSAR